jgi:hypothetical protein
MAGVADRLAEAHKAIMAAASGPSEALLRGQASRSALVKSVEQLKLATEILEEVIGLRKE